VVKSYTLTIASTSGGSVTEPGEGIFTYAKGKVVSLVTTPNACYHFANWSGDVSTIADINSATTTITMNGDYAVTANLEEEVMTFTDPYLEAAVRDIIGIPEGPIYPSYIGWSLNATAKNITDLSGLECASSLTSLYLIGNQVSDVSPLANLVDLQRLWLRDNQISDISPLANLTELTVLALSNNQITTIIDLANLTSLTWLYLEHNQISDISTVANFTSLTFLGLGGNQISDISPLANLTNADDFDLSDSQISDIFPLVQNEGLATGDIVDLRWNPLSSDSINIYIPQLEARGVTVYTH